MSVVSALRRLLRRAEGAPRAILDRVVVTKRSGGEPLAVPIRELGGLFFSHEIRDYRVFTREGRYVDDEAYVMLQDRDLGLVLQARDRSHLVLVFDNEVLWA